MRLTVESGGSLDVVVVSIDPLATIRDLAAALSMPVTDILAIDGVPYDASVRLGEIEMVSGSVVSSIEALEPARDAGRFWVGVVNGPGTGSVVRIDAGASICIGRDVVANELAIDNSSVSQRHAQLSVTADGEIEVEDLGSRNGTWLEGQPVSRRTSVEPGNTIRLGSSTLSIVEIDPADRNVGTSAAHADHTGRVLLNRPPRPPVPSTAPIVGLPAVREERAKPTLAVLSLVVPLIFAGVMVVALGSWRYAIFGLLSPVMAVGNWVSGRRRVNRERTNDGRLHVDALNRLQLDLHAAAQSERERRRAFAPNIIEVRRRVELPTRQLWERRLDSPDALTVRLGLGESLWEIETNGPAESPEAKVALDAAATLHDAEVLIDLRTGPVGLVGDLETAASVARNLVLQLAAHHGPADVRLAVLTTSERLDHWTWVQWLPHCTTADRSTHVLVGDAALEFASSLAQSALTWFLVVDDVELLHARSSPVRQALARGGSIFGLVLAPSEDALPSSVTTVVSIEPLDGVFELREPSVPAGDASGVLDLVSLDLATEIARSLSRFEDPETSQGGGSLPELVTAQDLHGEGLDVDAVRANWTAHADDRGLVCTIGVSSNGEFGIDMVADGPHSLVAGTTGSGKSELLRTLVVGLATNYDPSRVVFVLIDYKGGSAFDRCAALPHVVGVVTDLDDHLAERALLSLDAELRHRERQFRSVGAENIDAYRDSPQGRANAIPRLVVLIDEFATLRSELPGFVDSLVAIAQRGRSLGVHLVLATQRPSGSVDANIRANTNLRVALRVQDSSDSRDVVESSVAADISRTLPGRAFVRRGEGDLVAVQTGFMSGHVVHVAPAVRVWRPAFGRGETPTLAFPIEPTANSQQSPTDLDVLVEVLTRAAEGVSEPRRPWLDDLPLTVGLADVEGVEAAAGESSPVTIALGDDPANQRRVTRNWDPTDGHLGVFGVPDSGVTATIRRVIAALGSSELGRDAWVFAVDHAGGALAGVDQWVHVACLLDPTERERHERLLSYLEAELERRRALSPLAFDRSPLLVLAIDGVAAFMDSIDAEAGTPAADLMALLGRDGPTFGIVLIVGERRIADVPRVLRGQLRRHLMFEQADSNDFSAVGIRPSSLPAFSPGRALLGPNAMVCQVIDWESALRPNEITLERVPPVIEALESDIDSTRLSRATIDPRLSIPVGLFDATRTQAVLNLRPGEHATVAGPPGSGRTNTLRLVALQLRDASPDLVIVGVTSESDSTLLESTALDAGGSCAEIEHVLKMAADDDRRWIILVDDAERIDVEDGPLIDLARTPSSNVTMIVALRSSAGRATYGHWTRIVRASGIGVLLMPEGVVDGELLGARLPRTTRLQQVPGRGYLVAAGRCDVVQVALASPGV